MNTITIFAEGQAASSRRYKAVSGQHHSSGKTVGEALDALTSQMEQPEDTTVIVVQHRQPDEFFSAVQQQRLQELMQRWRAARDTRTPFPPEEQAELDNLIQEEVRGAGLRAAAMLQKLCP